MASVSTDNGAPTGSIVAIGATTQDDAIGAWRKILGADRVISDGQSLRRYTNSTIGIRRRVVAALRPKDTAQVSALVRVAEQHRVPLYPISTGRNWGYGSANPVTDGCAIVDLSSMDQVVAFDEDLGVVTVEPGVTQEKLWQYLAERGLHFLVPVHGGGPDCSILGNALERGYGVTPYADHFGAVTSIEAVLPSGEVYRSPLSELSGEEVDAAFKWGVGPYVDGLFSQGNFGIVTRATIALAPRPARTEAFFFSVQKEAALGDVVTAVRTLLRELGSNIGSLNLMNSRRVLAMMASYPADRVESGSAIPDNVIAEMAKNYAVTPWMGAGILYGCPEVVRAARSLVKRRLRPVARPLLFFDQGKITRLRRLAGVVPWPAIRRRARQLDTIESFLRIADGRPQRVALPLAYWKSGRVASADSALNPAADQCGLIWYSPLVAMTPHATTRLVEMVSRICPQYGIDPLITLTTLNDRVFDSTIPLIFRNDSEDQATRANACFDQLFLEGRALGALPYRIGIHRMQSLTSPSPYWRTVSRLKEAVDPHAIIAPGRYSVSPGSGESLATPRGEKS